MDQTRTPPAERPLSWYRSLKTIEGRHQEQAFLVEGLRAIEQINAIKPSAIIEFLTIDKCNTTPFTQCPTRLLSARQYNSISPAKNPAGTMAVVRLPENIEQAQIPDSPQILLLEDVQDPGNVGALIRSAAAFNFNGVIINDKCADPFGPKAVAASAGAVLSVWIRRTVSMTTIAATLKQSGYHIIATDLQGSESLQLESRQKYALALGNEGNGLSNELRNQATIRFKIPIDQHNVQSLNVAACGAIAMYLIKNR